MMKDAYQDQSPLSFFSTVEGILTSQGNNVEMHSKDGLTIRVRNTDRMREIFDLSKADLPLVFLMSGPSESGKSTFGRVLRRDGIATRFKILKSVNTAIKSGDVDPHVALGSDDPSLYLNHIKNHGPELQSQVGEQIVSCVIRQLNDWGTPIATVESMSHSWLVDAFQTNPRIRSISIFLNPPLTLRASREAAKEGITIEEAQRLIAYKDQIKTSNGIWEIRETCDIAVENAGDINGYTQFIKDMGTLGLAFTRQFSGTPFEYK